MWAAMQLSDHPDVCDALMRGVSVPREQLRPEVVERERVVLVEPAPHLVGAEAVGDLPGPRVAEAAGAQRDVVPGGHAIDVALVDDAAVGVQEVERDRGAALLPRARSVDRGRGRAVAVPQRGKPVEQRRAERADARVDRVDADPVEKPQADLDGG